MNTRSNCSRLLPLLLASLAAGSLAGQSSGKPWLRTDLPPGHPAKVKTWNVAYEIGFHVKGDEKSDTDGIHQKVDFHTDVTIKGEVTVEGPGSASPPPEAMRTDPAAMAKLLRRWISWKSKPAPARANNRDRPFARHLHDAEYEVDSWTWSRLRCDPAGGEDTTWTETDNETKTSGTGKVKLVVVSCLIFDMEQETYELQLSISDHSGELPLTRKHTRLEQSGDHNGSQLPKREEETGKLPLAAVLDNKFKSASWHGFMLRLQGRPFPEGSPESFTVDFAEPMTSIDPAFLPLALEKPAAWLKRNAEKSARVTVRCTVTRKG